MRSRLHHHVVFISTWCSCQQSRSLKLLVLRVGWSKICSFAIRWSKLNWANSWMVKNKFLFLFTLIKWVKLLVISNHKMLTFSNEHIGISLNQTRLPCRISSQSPPPSPRESPLPYPPPSATTSPAIVIGFWRRRRGAPAGRRFAPLFRCAGAAMPSLEATCAARARNWVLFSIYL